ncbi:hypothetical protein ACF5W4_02720 [Bacillota bacterium Lsc_1132]
MIIWQIFDEGNQWEIEVGPITILSGYDVQWYKLIRNIEDYFCNKSTIVDIFEDEEKLHKKDWECFFIPFDAHLQLDKLTAKSPLKPIIDELSEEIYLSPTFNELIDFWHDLKDEIELLGKRVGKYNLKLELSDFGIDNLKSHLTLKTFNNSMSPFDYKKLLLTLYGEKVIEKKRLILIELPELYAEDNEFRELLQIIQQFSEKGVWFIIISQKRIDGNNNYIFKGKVINNAAIESIKRIVLNEVPFVCNECQFNKAKNFLMNNVDNLYKVNNKISLSTGFKEDEIVVFFVLAKHLKLEVSIDVSGISPNLKEFIKTYSG